LLVFPPASSLRPAFGSFVGLDVGVVVCAVVAAAALRLGAERGGLGWVSFLAALKTENLRPLTPSFLRGEGRKNGWWPVAVLVADPVLLPDKLAGGGKKVVSFQ